MILLSLFWGFARVGLMGFGGGPAMLPLLQAECVGRGFVTEDQFLEGLAAGSALPGPITTKMAVYVGWHHAGLLGAVVASLGVVLPSAVLMAALGAFLARHRDNPWVAGALRGLKPAIVGLLAYVAWDLAPTGVRGWGTGALTVLAFAALAGKVHPGWVLLVAGGVGAVTLRG